ncbi:hypothetical protein [Desulfofustis limnaeus]|uniref:Uncharacterized protein n=1 Tax=Desulfofustis limnaeus TaxID=2740163 RepID=A0ABN6MBI3_9BACT|nr:hypothetical protein [Desulfofustis limnaeus]BDD88847.1 hypothetical protein DPPLL_32120 [Desulfofustis limnaeus]
MRFLDEVFDLLGSVTNAVMYAAGTVVGIAAAGVVEFAQVSIEKYNEYRERNRSVNLSLQNRSVHTSLSQINDSIVDLERKKRRDGALSHGEKDQLLSLCSQREDLVGEIRNNKELLMIEHLKENQEHFDSVRINNENTHILQFHVGQAVFGKKCRICGKPMVLQWRRGLSTVGMSDFFWGCISYYEGGSQHTEPFVQSDLDLFTKINRKEFEIPASVLADIVRNPGPQSSITRRMNGVKQEQTDVYLCPVHLEPMVLREKREADGLLDQYFFGCPRWLPNRQGCNQIVKLKSPAQLASALEAFYGNGIF